MPAKLGAIRKHAVFSLVASTEGVRFQRSCPLKGCSFACGQDVLTEELRFRVPDRTCCGGGTRGSRRLCTRSRPLRLPAPPWRCFPIAYLREICFPIAHLREMCASRSPI